MFTKACTIIGLSHFDESTRKNILQKHLITFDEYVRRFARTKESKDKNRKVIKYILPSVPGKSLLLHKE